jgi:hypothetical protein
VQADGRHTAAASEAIAGLTITVNDLVTAFVPEAADDVLALRTRHGILAEGNHTNFGVELLGPLDGFGYFRLFDDEHLLSPVLSLSAIRLMKKLYNTMNSITRKTFNLTNSY